MAQELLQGGQIRARLQQVRGKGMAEDMDAAALGDPRAALGRIVDLLGGGGIQGSGLAPLRK